MKKKLGTMVRVLILTLLLSMSMSTAVQAAVAKPKVVYNKAVKCYNNKKFEKAQKYFDKLARKAHEACVKNMDSGIKRAYLEVVKSYESRYGSETFFYYLTDIDKDKKPELIVDVRKSEAAAIAYVYSYLSGKATQMGVFHTGHSVLYYDPRGNGMTVLSGQMGYERIFSVKITSGRVVTEQWKVDRQLDFSEDYMDLPFILDEHVRWISGNRFMDYSPLR